MGKYNFPNISHRLEMSWGGPISSNSYCALQSFAMPAPMRLYALALLAPFTILRDACSVRCMLSRCSLLPVRQAHLCAVCSFALAAPFFDRPSICFEAIRLHAIRAMSCYPMIAQRQRRSCTTYIPSRLRAHNLVMNLR